MKGSILVRMAKVGRSTVACLGIISEASVDCIVDTVSTSNFAVAIVVVFKTAIHSSIGSDDTISSNLIGLRHGGPHSEVTLEASGVVAHDGTKHYTASTAGIAGHADSGRANAVLDGSGFIVEASDACMVISVTDMGIDGDGVGDATARNGSIVTARDATYILIASDAAVI